MLGHYIPQVPHEYFNKYHDALQPYHTVSLYVIVDELLVLKQSDHNLH